MTGLWVPDDTGTFVKVTKGLWASDVSGTFRPAKNGWVADGTGTFKKVWPYGVSINTFTVVKKAGAGYYQATLAVTATNAVKIEIYLAGGRTPTVTYNATSGTSTFTGVPGQRYSFTARAYASDGSYVDSSPVSVTLDALPAPANFRRTGGAYNNSGWAWNSVPAADHYEVVDTLHANAVKASVAATSWSETGLTASTTYERAVRAKLATATSGLSNKVRYTTPAAPGSPAGTYNFAPNHAEAWSPGYGYWRGSSSGIIHGNGDNWGGGNGDNVTFFNYNTAAIRALSGRVTRFKIYIRRDSVAGYSSPQLSRFHVHTSPSRPAGNPIGYLGAHTDTGALAWGQEALIDLPVVWGQWLIDGWLNASGIAWGYVNGRYMRGPGLDALASQGTLYITIG